MVDETKLPGFFGDDADARNVHNREGGSREWAGSFSTGTGGLERGRDKIVVLEGRR